MGLADLHIHSIHSYDGTTPVPALLEYVANETALDVIALTDHDVLEGTLAAIELAPHYGLEVIPGVEVSTCEGHLLALFVTQLVPRGRSLVDTVLFVRDLGGLCIVPHPGGPWSWYVNEASIQRALQVPGVAETLVGIESYNASLPTLAANRHAKAIGERVGLTPVGSSDAHTPWMIGLGATHFPGTTAADLRQALTIGTTEVVSAVRPTNFVLRTVYSQCVRWLPRSTRSLPRSAPGSYRSPTTGYL
jgi:predicted metal-dependent phosphoesterase TrpH